MPNSPLEQGALLMGRSAKETLECSLNPESTLEYKRQPAEEVETFSGLLIQ